MGLKPSTVLIGLGVAVAVFLVGRKYLVPATYDGQTSDTSFQDNLKSGVGMLVKVFA